MTRLRRTRTVFVWCTASACTLVGCVPGYWEGGNRASRDQYTYVSTTYQPKTISIIDTRTGQTVWTTDIPVGQQLAMRFYADDDDDGQDTLRWELMPAGKHWGDMTNVDPVPPVGARRVDMTLRPSPEDPPAN